MDEMMAAMVLTSLASRPVIQSPTQRDPLSRKSSKKKKGKLAEQQTYEWFYSMGLYDDLLGRI